MPEPKNLIELKAEKWVHNGYCLAFYKGETYFLSGAIPGEKVLAKLIYNSKKFKQAVVKKVLETSDKRIESDCPVFLDCGGCAYRHISYTEEKEIKKQLFIEQTGLRPTEIISAEPEGYRNNAQLKVDYPAIGFYRYNTNQLVNIRELGCKNLPVELNKFYAKRQEKITEYKLRLDDKGIINYAKKESQYKYGNISVRVPANGFFQVNRFLIPGWLDKIKSFVPVSAAVLELFSGCGLIGLYIADKIKSLRGYELDENSVKYSYINAEANKISNIDFTKIDLYHREIKEQDAKRDVYIMNPPRAGLDKLIVETILKFKPKTLIYSSCNYATLSRDIRPLIESKTYKVKDCLLFDFFPRTQHFECLIVLEKS
ncbi:MAG: class I SAM-dependent RNA methyltransferase [Leptospiraceae bacterium]|nr:class I SAM-dependent RNA methyltransferase [Leptospiraceae bacterium]MCP5499544.1 class I SAM-dependent RNA methyltransferase [Leptospiraceae bacterium]